MLKTPARWQYSYIKTSERNRKKQFISSVHNMLWYNVEDFICSTSQKFSTVIHNSSTSNIVSSF